MRLRTRQPIAGRRGRRRAGGHSLVSAARAGGALLSIAATLAVGWVLNADEFEVDESPVAISGLRYTDPDGARAAVGIAADDRPNVFRLRTRDMERALEALPAVADAEVRVTLPNSLSISVVERAPVLAVHAGGELFSVDADGVVLTAADAGSSPAAGLPLVDDRRAELRPVFEVGRRLNETDLAAMLQLAAVTPDLLESRATSLALHADDRDGYVLTAEPFGWRAIFGHYTPTLRPPDMIARQVQCLRSLLASGEADVAVAYLTPQDDRCGTFLPRATPRRSPSPSPSA